MKLLINSENSSVSGLGSWEWILHPTFCWGGGGGGGGGGHKTTTICGVNCCYRNAGVYKIALGVYVLIKNHIFDKILYWYWYVSQLTPLITISVGLFSSIFAKHIHMRVPYDRFHHLMFQCDDINKILLFFKSLFCPLHASYVFWDY